ncbi:MAG: hypothetical protein M0R33_15615 [Methylomonas sp.]|uniref:hypothetical protein n=1 Tax=Methylomonas sp. TaxID=418 RepID=UPI0025DD5679|nr:hypothetical protein [Methylomonas sp.]MCK9607871.1 hypothetical protein [Methylomonas sp.]
MIDVAHKHCDFPGCNILPSFGLFTDKRPTKCKIHASTMMIDITHAFCDFPGCTTRPVFGLLNDKHPTKCKIHADAAMGDVKSQHCGFPGCITQPSFGLPIDKRASRCKAHADAMMIYIAGKHCDFPGCSKQPTFGLILDKHPTKCKVHANAAMIDLRHGFCVFPECSTRANFNFRGILPQYCAKHRKPGMVNQPMKQCDICHHNLAEYGNPTDDIPSHCEQHKIPTEVNLAERVCKSCNISFVLNEQNLCRFCGSGVKSTHLMKQKEVEDYLKANLPIDIQQKWKSTDTTIDHGVCGRERPDFLFDADTHFVIVECDEHQHDSYPCECEQARMVNIANGLGMHTIFIRYNPDDYKYSAEYSTAKKMTPKVRHELLINILAAEIKRDIADIQPIEVIYICYDGCDTSCVSKHTILSVAKEEAIEPSVIQTAIDPQNEAPQA